MSSDPVFAAFCAAGLWPGLGRDPCGRPRGRGHSEPRGCHREQPGRIAQGGPDRAGRLLSSFIAAGPAYEVAQLLVPADVDARVAGRVLEALGPPAPRLLRDDPWLLLAIYGVTPAEADRVARLALPGVRRDDPRRGRALVGYVLTRIARDGHTVALHDDVLRAVSEFGVGDAQAAITAAVESAAVVEVADGELLGLARFAEAEDGIGQGLARLVATAEPIRADPKRSAAGPLDDAQRAAVSAGLRSGVSVLTGGPGTGKSRTVAAIVSLAEHAGRTGSPRRPHRAGGQAAGGAV